MFVNARAIIERQTETGVEIVIQTRNKSREIEQGLELPGGRVEEFESLIAALKREVYEETGLGLTQIEGQETQINTRDQETNVECLQPFAVYQTTRGPVDSMGVYFRCRAKGELLAQGDDTEDPHWISVDELKNCVNKFDWVDKAGILFYLKYTGEI